MAQPTPYVPSFDFSDFSTLNPDTPQPGVSLDAQFNAIKLTTDETLANLEMIQRDDGLLANGIVTPDSLSDELYAGISRAVPWATATAYTAGDLVWYLSILYSANSDHTSTTNPTVDTAKWTVILNMTATVPDVITQEAQDAADAAAVSAAAAAASAAGIVSIVSSVQYLWAGTATGAANTLVLTPVPTMASYAVGHKLRFVVGTTNTGTTTMNTDNALGSVTIKKSIGGALVNLVAGDLVAGTIAEIEYISGAAGYQLLNPATYSQGASVASATTVNLDTATGDYVSITGTTTITGITLAQGRERTVTFAGALTLTHGASLLLKNNGSDIVTAAGDSAVFRGEASGVVRMISYTAASGQAIAPPTPATIAEALAGAAGKIMDAATSKLFAGWHYEAIAATTSGSNVVLTAALPAEVREIEIFFNGISHNQTNQAIGVQLGDAGGYETTGYVSSLMYSTTTYFDSDTTRFLVSDGGMDATDTLDGVLRLMRFDDPDDGAPTFTWIGSGNGTRSVSGTISLAFSFGGRKSTTQALTSLRIILAAGNFDAGSARVRWKY